jgi:hypothetical protein
LKGEFLLRIWRISSQGAMPGAMKDVIKNTSTRDVHKRSIRRQATRILLDRAQRHPSVSENTPEMTRTSDLPLAKQEFLYRKRDVTPKPLKTKGF